MQLVHNETLIHQAKPHWIYLATPAQFVVIGFFFMCCATSLAITPPPPNQPPIPQGLINFLASCGGCFFIVALVTAILIILGFINATFYLTDKRVVAESGILSRSSREIQLKQIESVNVSMPLLGRILGYGTVVIIGSGGSRETLPKIANPEEIRHKIQNQIAKI